ncbi:porin family protein [Gilliamella sp. ESL0441]|uniref:outer membrane protein n=1 Tax=Gilliamella sp. ESL0441 TaxID=2704654 RepID=UPI001C6A6F76|nr:outer membrane protein [Gilliamella sp. ESL0441]QYN45096.1 porin family protein [Gilliamella sp. ESL0441]
MKKTVIALSTLACLSSFANAQNSGFYLGGQLGDSIFKVNSMKDTFYDDEKSLNINMGSMNKSKFAGALNLGYNFKSAFDIPVRAEISFTLRGDSNKTKHESEIDEDDDTIHTTNKVKAKMNTLMFNAYYDIDTKTSFTPFVGAGLGVAFTKLKRDYRDWVNDDYDDDYRDRFSKNKTKFAWSLAAGVGYKITDNLDFDFSARYLDAGKVKFKAHREDYDIKSTAKFTSVDLLAGIRYTF